jgi:hypothetical protein
MKDNSIKFMQTVHNEAFKILEDEAKYRDITVQELIRAVIIPDWIKNNGVKYKIERPGI